MAINQTQPKPISTMLSDGEIDLVAKFHYNRFDYEYGLRPQWCDNERIREIKKQEVRKMLDALQLAGYRVIKGAPNVHSLSDC